MTLISDRVIFGFEVSFLWSNLEEIKYEPSLLDINGWEDLAAVKEGESIILKPRRSPTSDWEDLTTVKEGKPVIMEPSRNLTPMRLWLDDLEVMASQ